MIEAKNEYLAVADLSGLRRGGDGLDDFFDLIGGAGDFELDLRQETDRVFGTAINLGVPFLAAVPLTSVTVRPWTPIRVNASRTSSSLNGLMMAVTIFIVSISLAAALRDRLALWRPGGAACV